MNREYITIAAISAPPGSVVIEFGSEDSPWCDVTPCLGLVVQAEFITKDDEYTMTKTRTTNERVLPIHEDVDEWGLAPSPYPNQMMLVTPLTSAMDILKKITQSRAVKSGDEDAVYDVAIEKLSRVGIYPQ